MSKSRKPRFVQFGPARVLTVPVNTRQYGHMALELAMGFAEAAQQRVPVFWAFEEGRGSRGLASLTCPGVRSIHGLPARAGVAVLSALDRARTRSWEWCREVVIEAQIQAHHEFKRDHYPRKMIARLKAFTLRPIEMPWRNPDGARPYMRRLLLRYPAPMVQSEPMASQARARARALGIADDQPLVALHVREAGFKLGREMQNAKANARDDSSRNARIESFRAALDLLHARGFKVVRIGDNSMTPYEHPALVDLTSITPYDTLLEVHCLLRSRLLIAGEAGPSGASYLTNTPLLTVNATDPISSYPIRRHGLMLLKRVRDRQSGRFLHLDDLIANDYATDLRNTTRYQYFDNTPEEIRDAVVEMLDDLDHPRDDTPAQAAFRVRVIAACTALGPFHAYVRKWGPEDGFLGDGRLAQSCIDSWEGQAPGAGAGGEGA